MLLLTGPPGSGKTGQVLNRVRTALEARRFDFRLLVPTATMAEHLRHTLAREGFLLRPRCIVTLNQFVRNLTPHLTPVSRTALRYLVREALGKQPAGSPFDPVKGLAGFHSVLASRVDEFALTGVTVSRFKGFLAASGADAGLAPAFLSIYELVCARLEERGWVLRATQLQAAAQVLAASGLDDVNDVNEVLVDGFFSFAQPELDLLDSIRRRAMLTVTLPDWPGAQSASLFLRARGLRETVLQQVLRAEPQRHLSTAPTLDQECDEIARRILQHHQQGVLFREMAVLARSSGVYFPALRLALERFGIPARFYGAAPALQHPTLNFLSRIVECLLQGWDWQSTLQVLRLPSSPAAMNPDGDQFEERVLKAAPGQGLEGLRQHADGVVVRLLEQLQALEPWRDLQLAPAEWAVRLHGSLPACLLPPEALSAPTGPRDLEMLRSQAAAVRVFGECLLETAAILAPLAAISLDEFWKTARWTLQDASLHVPEPRRDVVHVIDAYEARQWELPVVFVCGLLERQFPAYHSQDAIFPDGLRYKLQEFGLQLRTVSDWDQEERFLFSLATSRATRHLVLSYPSQNELGDSTLPSFLLQTYCERHGITPVEALPVAPAPASIPRHPSSSPIRDFGLLAHLATTHRSLRVTAVERFLQCPFQFFAAHTLRVEGLPEDPGDRVTPAVMGTIVHRVLEEWNQRREQPIAPLVERHFAEYCREVNIPHGHKREIAYLELMRHLSRFAEAAPAIETGAPVAVEAKFQYPLDAAGAPVQVTGRIDCHYSDASGAGHILEFKYTGKEGLRKRLKQNSEGTQVQAGLYLAALEKCFQLTPASLTYFGLRGDLLSRTFSGSDARRVAAEALAITSEAAAQMLAGDIEPRPTDTDQCRYCDFRHACRYRAVEAAEETGAAAP